MSPSLRPTPLLDKVNWPRDLRLLAPDQLPQLAAELRTFVIDTVAKTGGHFASGLGAVELTVALHYVFDTPNDLLVWDVGHQTYPHKVLTGRRDRLKTIRQAGGLSGFTNRSESEYDVFGAAHASTAISAALGMAIARDLRSEKREVVAIVGDGGLTGGVAMEGLNQAGYLKSRLLVILNDNDMSISPNVGAMSGYLLRIARGQIYHRVRGDVAHILKKLPAGQKLAGLAEALEDGVKKALVPGTLFEELGFRYVGPIDGHNLPVLLRTLRETKQMEGPVLLHVRTVKGKGYQLAERDPVYWHGPAPFQVETGEISKKAAPPSYTAVFADALSEIAEKDSRVVESRPRCRRARESTALRKGSLAAPSTWASASSTPCSSPPASRRRGSGPCARSTPRSCSAPTIRSCTTSASWTCPLSSRSTGRGSSARTVRRITAFSI
jgi:1-deoxy-D-xylulose-5-phosphate synthase